MRFHTPGGSLIEGPVTRALISFAIPAIAANVLHTVQMTINAMWVGRLIGHEALAAAANIALVLGLVHSVTFGFGMAVTILIARAMGAGDIKAMRRHFGAGIGIFAVAGLVFAMAGVLATDQVLKLLDMPPGVHALAFDYARISFVAMPAGLLFTFLILALRSAGDFKTPLLFAIFSALADAALNPILILGLGPAPQLGIAGSALASLISMVAGLALLIGYVYARDLPVRLRGNELRLLIPPAPLIWTILRQGVPMGLQMIIASVAALAIMEMVNSEGAATVAAFAAVNQLWGYVQMPAMGLGSAASIMAAQNIGAGRWARVDRIALASAALGFGITLFVVLVLLIFDRMALSLFLSMNGEDMAIARHINLCATWSFVIFGAAIPLVVIPRANGANVAPLLIMTIMFIPCRLGFAHALRPYLGADALWWSYPVSFIMAGLLIFGYYRYGGWRRLKVLQ